MPEWLEKIDLTVFYFINGSLSNSFFDIIMPFLTNQNNWILPLLAGILWMVTLGGKKGRIAAIILLLAFIISDVVAAQLIKPYIGRIRPSHTMVDSINLLVKKGGKWSFPSNHASNTMALAVIISYFWPKVRYWFIVLSLLIGFTRIYVGVHYPLDVLGGWILGYSVAWFVLSIWVITKMREIKRGKLWVWYEGDPPEYSG